MESHIKNIKLMCKKYILEYENELEKYNDRRNGDWSSYISEEGITYVEYSEMIKKNRYSQIDQCRQILNIKK